MRDVDELRAQANRCHAVAARYSETERSPLTKLADDLDRQADLIEAASKPDFDASSGTFRTFTLRARRSSYRGLLRIALMQHPWLRSVPTLKLPAVRSVRGLSFIGNHALVTVSMPRSGLLTGWHWTASSSGAMQSLGAAYW